MNRAIARLRALGWHATADVLAADSSKARARAATLLKMPTFVHTPQDLRALSALRRIARGA